MSVNFGYGGMGMMNGMNSMGNSGNVFRDINEKYSCNHCYQNGPVQYNYQMHVNPLPEQVTNPSFLSRFLWRFMGG